jgi:hypothetical protein
LINKIDADNSGAVDLNEFKAAIYEEFKNKIFWNEMRVRLYLS